MKAIGKKRCVIGEGPLWNEQEQRLYFTNGMELELCSWEPTWPEVQVRKLEKGIAAIAFSRDGRMIVSRYDGVFYLDEDNTATPLYDTAKYTLHYANDMKAGPDGRLYVGTQSGKCVGSQSEENAVAPDRVDGKLVSIDKDGTVKTLLSGLLISNGMDWSMDEKRFYHTDSATNIIREYEFIRETGDIHYTGRCVQVPGVDGFTIDRQDRILSSGWGHSCVYVIDTRTMQITERIPVPSTAPASCGFAGENLDDLVVVTANYNVNAALDPDAGRTWLEKRTVGGRAPYLFG